MEIRSVDLSQSGILTRVSNDEFLLSGNRVTLSGLTGIQGEHENLSVAHAAEAEAIGKVIVLMNAMPAIVPVEQSSEAA